MKIRTDNQQSTVATAQPVEKGDGQQENAAVRPKAKAPSIKDSVELSAALDAELKSQEAEQAKRVEQIKARLASGEYQVSSRAVAEKMLTGRSEE